MTGNRLERISNLIFSTAVVVCFQFIMGCVEEEQETTIGFSKNENKYKTVYLDTFTVKIATLLLDSIRTSGTGRILTGEYRDINFGSVSSISYLRIAPNEWILPDEAVYDSMSLILFFDGYYYGDTTQVQRIDVTELSQSVEGRSTQDKYLYDDIPYSHFYSEGVLYNVSALTSFNRPIGTASYYPRPLTADSLTISLDDRLGKEWFDLKKVNSSDVSDNASFAEYFKGLKLTAEGLSVIGFVASSMKVRMYYREVTSSGLYEELHHDFVLYESNLQYNQIQSNRSGTALSILSPLKPIGSELTNDESFIQAGTGIMTKLDFPYLDKIFEEEENIVLVEATLEVSPKIDDTSLLEQLPDSLSLFYTNKTNVPIGVVASEQDASAAQIARVKRSTEYEQEASYSFVVTSYVNNLLRLKAANTTSLLLGLPSGDFVKEVTRARIGNSKNKQSNVKLKIYYTTYD